MVNTVLLIHDRSSIPGQLIQMLLDDISRLINLKVVRLLPQTGSGLLWVSDRGLDWLVNMIRLSWSVICHWDRSHPIDARVFVAHSLYFELRWVLYLLFGPSISVCGSTCLKFVWGGANRFHFVLFEINVRHLAFILFIFNSFLVPLWLDCHYLIVGLPNSHLLDESFLLIYL